MERGGVVVIGQNFNAIDMFFFLPYAVSGKFNSRKP
jgi:hypothetical protein